MPLGLFPEENAQAMDTLYRGSPMGPPQPHWYSGALTEPLTGIAEGAAKVVVPLQADHVPVVGYNLPASAYDEEPKPVSPQFRAGPQAAAADMMKQLQSDPATTGWVGQILHNVASLGSRFVTASAIGGPLAGAAFAGGTEAAATYQRTINEGMDEHTAKQLAAADGLLSGAGMLLPVGVGGGTAIKMLSGATINLAAGAGSRALTHTILENAGYPEQAQQYKVLDAQSLASDAVLGLAFGWLARNHEPQPLPQRVVDAAHVAEDSAHVETGLFGDIPTNAQSRNDHMQNVIDATRAELNGEPVSNMRSVETVPNPAQEAAREAGAKGLAHAVDEAHDELVGTPVEPIEAFHGTAHDFDAFNLGAIGSGEGAQAFGHGLYFAESSGVANDYRVAVSEKTFINKVRDLYDEFDSPSDAEEALQNSNEFSAKEKALMAALKKDGWLGFDYPHQAVSAVLGDARKGKLDQWDLSPETKKAVDEIGNIYHVKLNIHPETMLDWDRTLGEQSQFVRDRLQLMEDHINSTGGPKVKLTDNMTGEQLAALLGVKDKGASRVAASKFMESIGLKGIVYLDRSSRKAGEGSRNFVVFSDKDVEITKKNQQEVASSGSTLGPAARAEEAAKAEAEKTAQTAAADPELADALAQVRDIAQRNPGKLFKNPETGDLAEPADAMKAAMEGMQDAEGEGKLGEIAAACFGRG